MNLESAAALAGAGAGVAVLYRPLRTRCSPAAAVATGAALWLGSGLGWAVFPAADARATAAFVLSALGVAWLQRPARAQAAAGAALLVAAALAVALGPDLARLHRPRLSEALFSSRHGLFFWNPVAWIGLAGLPLWWRRDRWNAGALVIALSAVVVVVAGLPAELSGPWAARRWTPALPLVAPPATAALDALVQVATRRPGRLLAAAATFLVAWNLLFMEQYRGGLLPRDGTVSFVAVTENNAKLLSGLVGSPPAWPVNWAFAWRHALPVDRYDLLAGKRLPRGVHGREIDLGDLALDAALLLEGWSVRHPCGEAVCRAVEGRARLVAPVEDAAPFVLAVRAAGHGDLSAEVNGVTVGRRRLSAEMATLRFAPGPSGRELSEVSFALTPDGRALVDRVHLEPAGGGP